MTSRKFDYEFDDYIIRVESFRRTCRHEVDFDQAFSFESAIFLLKMFA